jgi:hypothetical protein
MPKLSNLESTERKSRMFEIYGLRGNAVFYLTTDIPFNIGPEKHCAGKSQQHIQKTEPSSRQRGSPTETRP